jgi:CRP-like cAMP-binding protein
MTNNNPDPADELLDEGPHGIPAAVRYCRAEDGRHGQAVENSPFFCGFLRDDYMRAASNTRVKEFNRGEILYIEGDPVQHVLLLVSGSVKTTQHSENGLEVILGLNVPGDVLGAVGLFSAGRHCTTAQAFRPCRALVWDTPSFKALVDRFPVLRQNLIQILGQYTHELEQRFREVATEKVAPRVAQQLARLAKKMGRPVDGAVEVCVSREELAQMTGTTLFTVSRLLSSWEALGLVRLRREAVAIYDVASLKGIARGREVCLARASGGTA